MSQPITARIEGRIWLSGVALLLLLGLEFLLVFVLWPEKVQALVLGLIAEVLTGREGGIPVGIAAGAPRFLIWQVSFTQDIAGALFAYPLFLLLLHRYHDRNNALMRRVRLIEAAADRHQAYVHRWGPLGLAVFMLVPFLVNGPLVAMIVGRLAGMRTRDVLPPVVVATIIVAAAWTYFFDRMNRLATAVDPRLGWGIALVAVVVVVGLAGLDFLRDLRAQRRIRMDGERTEDEESPE